MYRVFLSGSGKAYAKECNVEDIDFIENLKAFVDNGDIVLFCEDLDDLEDILGDKYEVEEVYGEE